MADWEKEIAELKTDVRYIRDDIGIMQKQIRDLNKTSHMGVGGLKVFLLIGGILGAIWTFIKITDYDIVFDRTNPYKSGKNKGKDRKRSILQGNRIEHPDFIDQEKLELDYSFYITNQIMNPVKQVLDLNSEYLETTQMIFDKYVVTDEKLYEYMSKYK